MSNVLETEIASGPSATVGVKDAPYNASSVSVLSLPERDYKERYDSGSLESSSVGVLPTWQQTWPASFPEGDAAVLRSPDYKRDTDAFRVLQKWQGHVLDVRNGVFLARLHDLTGRVGPEDVELDVDDVPVHDREFLRNGAVFYWKIGYLDRLDGQRIRASVIRFRRRPVWREDEIQAARETARKWAALWATTD